MLQCLENSESILQNGIIGYLKKDDTDQSLKISIPLHLLPGLQRITSLDGYCDETESYIISIPRIHFDQIASLSQLRCRISKTQLPNGWVVVPCSNTSVIVLCYFADPSLSTTPLVSLTVSEQLDWTVLVHGRKATIPPSFTPLFKISKCETVIMLLEKLSSTSICAGNSEEKFISVYIA